MNAFTFAAVLSIAALATLVALSVACTSPANMPHAKTDLYLTLAEQDATPTPMMPWTLVYGPVDEAEYRENEPFIDIADGIVEVTLQNPDSPAWRLLVVFRSTIDEPIRSYAVTIDFDQTVGVSMNDGGPGKVHRLWEDVSHHVNTVPGERNKVKVDFRGASGKFWINDNMIAHVDLAKLRGPGQIFILELGDDQVPVFDGLMIWQYN